MNEKTESHLRYYGTDIVPCVGDHVRFVDHPEDLIVEDVINTNEKKKEWGLTDSGVMLRGEKQGLVFDPVNDPEIEFVRRKT